ncbi:MAG: glycine cleavage T C-terminal barrel domain-containing protein [Phycisphaerae bacterium]
MPNNPLESIHEQAEAAFLPYGEQLRIVESYGEMEAEYAALRKNVALMDTPQRGVVLLTGKDRLTFLNKLLTNDLLKLSPGQGLYSFLLQRTGRILFDLNVLHEEEATLLEVDIRLTKALAEELERYHFSEEVRIMDAADQLGHLTLLGPAAGRLLDKLVEGGIASLNEPLRHDRRTLAHTTVTIFRHDQAGVPGYELIVPRDSLVTVWQVLTEAGNGHEPEGGGGGLRAIGWSAFNTARIEAGTPLFGIDLTDTTLPLETGPLYLRAVSLKKGCYVGQEIVARMHTRQSAARLFVGLRVKSDKLPFAGTGLFAGTEQVGLITSSCMSPMLGYTPVAMGYVRKELATLGHTLETLAEGARASVEVAPLPFWPSVPETPPTTPAP